MTATSIFIVSESTKKKQTINYKCLRMLTLFIPLFRLIDPKTRKVHHVRVAFQVCVKPGSYKVGPQSIGANEPIDPQINNNEIEWSTKERGSVLLHSLLLKVE